jgi:hypothetical protein
VGFQEKISGAPSDIGDLRDRLEDLERNMTKVTPDCLLIC